MKILIYCLSIHMPGQKFVNTFKKIIIFLLLSQIWITVCFFNNNSSDPITVIGFKDIIVKNNFYGYLNK